MGREIYQRLAVHLDREVGGFAPSTTGADVRLLQELYTEAEAELALALSIDQQDVRAIARRAGLPLAEAAQRLEEMANKGTIFPIYRDSRPARYQMVSLGMIWDMKARDLTPELLQAHAEYGRTREPRTRTRSVPWMRTIPITKSLTPQTQALPYELAAELTAEHDRIAISLCICRTTARLRGQGCTVPDESCMMFGDLAEYYYQSGRGRRIDHAEVTDWLAQSDALNLVLQPTNSQDIGALCSCCGCCCGVLWGLKTRDRPADHVTSSFIARFDPAACQGCMTCLERCPMDALSADGDVVVFDEGRCIGCGLCVSTCPSGALTLARKPALEEAETPADIYATWRAIREAQVIER
jgi:ferredoxin